jgi:hypothetical protein
LTVSSPVAFGQIWLDGKHVDEYDDLYYYYKSGSYVEAGVTGNVGTADIVQDDISSPFWVLTNMGTIGTANVIAGYGGNTQLQNSLGSIVGTLNVYGYGVVGSGGGGGLTPDNAIINTANIYDSGGVKNASRSTIGMANLYGGTLENVGGLFY